MRACRFRYGFLCERISLAANMHSLVRSSKRMLERRQHLSYCGLAAVSFKMKILARPNALSPANFRLFAPPYLGTFQLSFTLLLRYRSQDVFSLGGW